LATATRLHFVHPTILPHNPYSDSDFGWHSLAFLALNLERMLAVRRVCADGFFLALLSGLSFSQSHFMYFYGRLQPLTLLPLGPESGNRKLLLIMLLTLCCQHRSTPSVPTPCVCLRSCLWSYADGPRCWLV